LFIFFFIKKIIKKGLKDAEFYCSII